MSHYYVSMGIDSVNSITSVHDCLSVVSSCTLYNRLDSGGGIRVGDFGLAEDVYASGYFRQNDRANVKLPYKWMALESLNDAIFTEKTDVVSQSSMVDLRQYPSGIATSNINCSMCPVVVRCDCVGDLQWRTDSLPCRGPTLPHPAAGRRTETRETSQCSLCH